MVTQVVAVLLLLLGWERFPLLLGLGKIALWAVLATALGSAADYFWRFSRAVPPAAAVTDFAAAQARRERAKADRTGAGVGSRRPRGASPAPACPPSRRRRARRGRDRRSPSRCRR